MGTWRKVGLFALIGCTCAIPSRGQCGFAIVPAADLHWYSYSAEGWTIPGLADAKSIAPIRLTIDGGDVAWPPGITVSFITHDDDYHVSFPEAFFDDNGTLKKMLASSFKLKQMLRWEFHGQPYAYSYFLVPHVACDTTIDIIDDRGDGKFRLMVSPGHVLPSPQPPPLPEYLTKPNS